MNKRKAKKNFKKISKDILKYFHRHDGYLEILDEDTRPEIDDYSDYYEGNYKSVTAEYIQKYVLNSKYTLKTVKYVLMKLVITGEIKSFKCNDINEIVFLSYDDWGLTYYSLKSFLNAFSNRERNYKENNFLLAFNYK